MYKRQLIEMVKITYPPWILGLLGSGAVAAALSTAAALLHTSGALLSRNTYQRLLKSEASSIELVRIARVFTAAIALIALYLAIVSPKLIVFLLLTGYAGVTQFAPGVILGTSWKRITKNGVLAGLIAGILTVIVTRIIYTDPFGVFGGFWGLMVNTLVTIIVSVIEGKK